MITFRRDTRAYLLPLASVILRFLACSLALLGHMAAVSTDNFGLSRHMHNT